MIQLHIQTRGYEMDATRTIPPAVLLRYMEEGRWQLIRSKEVGLERFASNVVVAAQSLYLFKRVCEYVDLEIHVWLNRVGKTSLDMAQIIYEKTTRQPVAMSKAIMVNVDAHLRPQVLDAKVKELITPAPLLFDQSLFPVFETREVPEQTWHMDRNVMASELDLLQHVNHSRYVDYAEDARLVCSEANGYEVGENKQVTDQYPFSSQLTYALTIEYLNEVRFGNKVRVVTWPGAKSGDYHFQIRNGDVVSSNAILRCST